MAVDSMRRIVRSLSPVRAANSACVSDTRSRYRRRSAPIPSPVVPTCVTNPSKVPKCTVA
jgi:hypothetical protein